MHFSGKGQGKLGQTRRKPIHRLPPNLSTRQAQQYKHHCSGCSAQRKPQDQAVRTTGIGGVISPSQGATRYVVHAKSGDTRWPVSRVLSKVSPPLDSYSSRRRVTTPLKQPTRTYKRVEPTPALRLFVPIWFCSGWGLPCHGCYHPRGALLPHLFTLTRLLTHPSGIFSVALSLTLPWAGITRHPVPSEPGLSSGE